MNQSLTKLNIWSKVKFRKFSIKYTFLDVKQWNIVLFVKLFLFKTIAANILHWQYGKKKIY